MPEYRSHFTTFSLTALAALISVRAYAQPALTILEQPDSLTLNEPATLVFEVSWEGNPEEYVANAPSVALEAGGAVQSIETISQIASDGAVFRHRVTILPDETGEFTMPELQFPYSARVDLPEMMPPGAKMEEVPTPAYEYLVASPFTFTVGEPSDTTLTLMGLLFLGSFMFVCAYVFYRRNAVQIATMGESVTQTVPSYVHEARKHRLDDDYYQFYQNLVEGVALLHDSEEKHRLHRLFTDQAMAVGYKGAQVTEDELDGALKDLERAHANDRKSGRES